MKLFINQCRYQDLFTLSGVGRRVADRIWEILTTKGFIAEDDLATIPYLRITRALLDSIDFSLLSDETMNENSGCDKGGGGEYRPTPVSRYHSPGGQGVYGGPKNRPTMLGQSRLEERGRSRTRNCISGLSQQGASGRNG